MDHEDAFSITMVRANAVEPVVAVRAGAESEPDPAAGASALEAEARARWLAWASRG
jgi:hypothetical protein